MKTRNGFVSNSSSSSFVVLMSEKNFDRVMKYLTPFQIAVAKWLSKEASFEGQKCVATTWESGDYDTFELLSEKEYEKMKEFGGDDFYDVYEARRTFLVEAQKEGAFVKQIGMK